MKLLSSVLGLFASPITNKSQFSLYSGTTSNQSQKHNQQYSNHIYITKLSELIAVAENYSHTPHSFRNSKRAKSNWEKTNCLILDIDNSHSENPEDWLDTNTVSQLIGVSHYIIPSKSHLKWKTDIDGSIRKDEGDSPRPRLHIYIPTEQDIEDADLFEYLSDTIKEHFTVEDYCLIDTAVNGRSGSFFSSNSIDREYCSFVARNTNFFDWIEQISYQSVEEFKNKRTHKKASKKGQRSIKILDPNVKDKNLLFLGKFGFLVKDYPNENGTWQIQHLGEKSAGGYYYDLDNKKIWKHSNENWDVYDFLQEFQPHLTGDYCDYIGLRDERETVKKFIPYTEAEKRMMKFMSDKFFVSGKDVVVCGTEGSGKSKIAGLISWDFIKTGKNVGIFTQTNEQADEKIEKLLELGIPSSHIIRIAGRSYKDNCVEPDIDNISKSLSKKGLSTTYSVCKQCPSFQECKYYKQFQQYNSFTTGKIFVMVRDYLAINLPNNINPTLHRIIIDENPVSFISDNRELINVKDVRELFKKYQSGFTITIKKKEDDNEEKYYDLKTIGLDNLSISLYDFFTKQLKECSNDEVFRDLVSTLNDDNINILKDIHRVIWGIEKTLSSQYRSIVYDSNKLFSYISKLRENKAFRGIFFDEDTITLLDKKKVIDRYKNTPKMILDSNGRDSKSNLLSDIFETDFEKHNSDIESKVHITQVNKTYSKATLTHTDKKGQKTFSYENELGGLIRKEKDEKILFFIRKNSKDDLEEYLKTSFPNLEYEITHMNRNRGIDKWKDYGVCIYIGWYLEPIYSIIERYNTLYPDNPLDRHYEDYDEKEVLVRDLSGNSTQMMKQKCLFHPDKKTEERLNELIMSSLNDECSQSISRLRFVHTDVQKRVYILNTQLTGFPINTICSPKKFREGNYTSIDTRLNYLLLETDFDKDILVMDFKVLPDTTLWTDNSCFKKWRTRTFRETKGIKNYISKCLPKVSVYSYSWGRGTNQYFVLSGKTYDETKKHLENHYLSALGVKTIRDGIEPTIFSGSTELNSSLPEKHTSDSNVNEAIERKRKLLINIEKNNPFPLLPFEIEDEIPVRSLIDTINPDKPPSTYGFI